jgi:cytochrome c556
VHRKTAPALVMAVGLVAFGLSVMANEKPSADYQNVMKSNGATAAALRMHMLAKDYDAILADALTLENNYARTLAYWQVKKVFDATEFAADGARGVAALETAAKAKNDEGITAAQNTIAGTCSGCHMAHREQLPDQSFEIK